MPLACFQNFMKVQESRSLLLAAWSLNLASRVTMLAAWSLKVYSLYYYSAWCLLLEACCLKLGPGNRFSGTSHHGSSLLFYLTWYLYSSFLSPSIIVAACCLSLEACCLLLDGVRPSESVDSSGLIALSLGIRLYLLGCFQVKVINVYNMQHF